MSIFIDNLIDNVYFIDEDTELKIDVNFETREPITNFLDVNVFYPDLSDYYTKEESDYKFGDHEKLLNIGSPNQHPIKSITGLEIELNSKANKQDITPISDSEILNL